MDPATWILVIEVISLFPGDLRLAPSRTRGMTEANCLILAQEVRSPTTISYCYRDGDKDPGWGPWAWGWRDRTKEPRIQDCAAEYFRGSCVWPLSPGRRRV